MPSFSVPCLQMLLALVFWALFFMSLRAVPLDLRSLPSLDSVPGYFQGDLTFPLVLSSRQARVTPNLDLP